MKRKDRSSLIMAYALALTLVGTCVSISLAADMDDQHCRGRPAVIRL